MRLSDYIKDIRKKGQRYFTVNEAVGILQVSKNAVMIAAHRLKIKGDLISPARGFYVIVPPEDQPYGSVPAEELVPILIQHLQIDYYVALLSAAEFYGAAHQKVSRFQIITNKQIKHPLDFGNVSIQVIYKKSLAGLPIKNFTVASGLLKVASPELIVFDLFNYTGKSAGLNHMATVLSELVEALDKDKLIELANKIGEKAWLQRLGFILEKIETMNDKKSEVVLKAIEKYLGQKKLLFVPLAPELPKAGCKRDKKWHIIENTNIESDLDL